MRIDARPATDERLQAIAAAVTIDATGRPTAAALPDEMHEIASGRMGEVTPVMEDVPFPSSGATRIYYTGPTPAGNDPGFSRNVLVAATSLTTGPASSAELATAGIDNPNLATARIGGRPAWIGHRDFGAGQRDTLVIWERDGQLFALHLSPLAAALDPIALAESVRPATGTELPPSAAPGSGASEITAVPATTAAPTQPTAAPAPTVHPSDAAPVIVDVAKTDVSDNEVELRAASPDGVAFKVSVLVLADGVKVTGQNGGQTVLNGPRPADQQVQIVSSGGNGSPMRFGALAVTSDPAARYVEVLRSNGLRYRAALTATRAHPETRIGAVLVPEGELVSGSLLDAGGRVLATKPVGG